jgi:HK97 family phage major capsid protein
VTYKTKGLREQIGDDVKMAESILDAIDADIAAGRCDSTSDTYKAATAKFQALMDGVERKHALLNKLESKEDKIMLTARELNDLEADDAPQSLLGNGAPKSKPTRWVDQHGKPVYVLAKGQRWSDLPRERDKRLEGVTIGDCIKASITGKTTPEIRAAMSEGTNTSGGFLVPDELLIGLVDKARAASVIMRAGAQTVPMSSETLRMARLASDATFEHKEENAAFVGSDITFDAITFATSTLGTVVTASRELAEDAPNFASEVEAALVAAFAVKLDDVAINGMGPTDPDGILDWPSGTGLIGETGSIGAIAWEDLHAAVVAIQLLNYQPNAYVLNPEIAGDLAILTSGDGTNSAKLWLPPPPTVAPLTSLPTTSISNASIIVGDFTKAVWGVRHGAILETTREAAEAFEKHQFKIKLVWRGDFNATRRDAFHRLVGVTS